jgi:hypothetical protein
LGKPPQYSVWRGRWKQFDAAYCRQFDINGVLHQRISLVHFGDSDRNKRVHYQGHVWIPNIKRAPIRQMEPKRLQGAIPHESQQLFASMGTFSGTITVEFVGIACPFLASVLAAW